MALFCLWCAANVDPRERAHDADAEERDHYFHSGNVVLLRETHRSGIMTVDQLGCMSVAFIDYWNREHFNAPFRFYFLPFLHLSRRLFTAFT